MLAPSRFMPACAYRNRIYVNQLSLKPKAQTYSIHSRNLRNFQFRTHKLPAILKEKQKGNLGYSIFVTCHNHNSFRHAFHRNRILQSRFVKHFFTSRFETFNSMNRGGGAFGFLDLIKIARLRYNRVSLAVSSVWKW